MRNPSSSLRRALPLVAVALVCTAGIATVAVGATGPAGGSRAGKVKIKCPVQVLAGKKVTCRVFGRLPHGPAGPRGQRGARGARGEKGAAGAPGVSGYEVVSQTFKEVFIENSGGMRGLSAVQAVACPAGKRVLGGGADLGTNATQNGQQRSVTVSLSGPNGTGTGWSVQLFNNETTGGGTSIDLRVFAICARVG